MENDVSFCMCSAVEHAWLAQNIDIAVDVCDCIYSGVYEGLSSEY